MPHTTQTSSSIEHRLPRVVVVSGPAGSGKTTLARRLAATVGYALADLDTVTGPLTEIALELSPDAGEGLDSPAGRRLRSARYATLLDLARDNLQLGVGVVLAAPFTTERRSGAGWATVTARLGLDERGGGAGLGPDEGRADAALLYLSVPADLRHRRLLARAAPRDRAKLRSGPDTPGTETLAPDAVVLDGTATVERQLAAALDALRRSEPARTT